MTSKPLDRLRGSSLTIPEIVAQAGEGTIRVPTFQRQFVWTARDVRDLFDSLYRGFPVGTLLLWRRPAPKEVVAFGPIHRPVAANTNALWVVDGQQRITSLFGSLSRDTQGIDDRFEVYFDFESQKFINPRKGNTPPRSIPVREALETRLLLNWLRTHSDELEAEDLDLADKLGGAFRDYTIPAYIVSGEDQILLREVFDRVNSAGKPISRAQVFHALFASEEDPGSPASVSRALAPLGFGGFDENRIVQSLLAIRGGNVQRDLHGEFQGGGDPADWYDRTEQALIRSIAFLRSEGVPHLLLMPNTLPLPVLAAFFHLHPEPEPWSRRLLSRWLWRGWVHGFGREGGQTPILRRAIQSVNPEHMQPDLAPAEYDALHSLLRYTPDREAPMLSVSEFTTKNANPRLILLALASLSPRWRDGTSIDIGAEFERHGTEAVTELIPRHRTKAAARSFWPVDSETSIQTVHDEEILRTHAITPMAAKALRERSVDAFLKERGSILQELTYAFLDSRMEPNALIRPSLRDLALLGTSEGSDE